MSTMSFWFFIVTAHTLIMLTRDTKKKKRANDLKALIHCLSQAKQNVEPGQSVSENWGLSIILEVK